MGKVTSKRSKKHSKKHSKKSLKRASKNHSKKPSKKHSKKSSKRHSKRHLIQHGGKCFVTTCNICSRRNQKNCELGNPTMESWKPWATENALNLCETCNHPVKNHAAIPGAIECKKANPSQKI